MLLVDGAKLTEVSFKAGEPVSVSEQDYDTELEALRTATSKRSRRLVVWCGLVTARVARPVESAEHPDATPLADARYLMKVFGADHFVAMSGSVALSPDAQTEVIEHLASAKPRMVLSGMCVDLEQDGIWVRVGRRNVEATLVHKGAINGWIALCEGLDFVAQQIQDGESAAKARSELADRVAGELRMAIMQWQRTRTVPPQIWLHGPGGDPSGEVHQALLLNSGCRVAPPNMTKPSSFELMQHIPLLPTVLSSLEAPILTQPQRVLRKAGVTRKLVMLRTIAVAAGILLGLAVLSGVMGANSKRSLAAKEVEIERMSSVIDPEVRANANKLRDIEAGFKVMEREPYPDWSMLFRLAERFPGEEGQLAVSSDRERTSITAEICCDGIRGYEQLMQELDEWAEAIYGPGAYAVGGSSVFEDLTGSMTVSAALGYHE